MKIKIRVKHLVLFVLIPASLLVILFNFLPSQIQKNGSTAVPPNAARIELLQKLNSTTGSKRMELIRKNVIDAGGGYDPYRFDLYIGSSMSVWSNNASQASRLLPEDRVTWLEEYIREGPADDTLLFAVKQLVYEYDALGHKGDGDQSLVTTAERVSNNSSLAKQIALLQAERALNDGDLAVAELILDQLSATKNQEDLDAQKAWLTGRLLFAKGKTQEALTLVINELNSYKKWWNDLNSQFNTPEPNKDSAPTLGTVEENTTEAAMQLEALRKAIQSAIDTGNTTPAIVSGTLTRSDGSPVFRAGIFLRSESEVNHSVTYAEPYRIVTDAEGRFEFHNVTPGFYQIQLGLSFDQIDGWTWPEQYNGWLEVKQGGHVNERIILQPLIELQSPINQETLTGQTVDFRWKAVKGAAYYRLNGGVSDTVTTYSSQIRDHITDNQVSIPVAELYYSSGFSFGSDGDDWETIDPLSLMGFLNSEARFSWNIEAFDAQGRLLTRSNGYRLNDNTALSLPFFYLKERTLTTADRLFLNKKPKKALEAYQKMYDEDPTDVATLHMLVRLMTAKASITKDKSLEAETIPLLKKLIQLYPSSIYAYTLAHYYFEQEDWDRYHEYYSMYSQLSQEEPDAYDRSINAIVLMHQGQLEEARKQFAIALDEDDTHRFIGSYLAAELYAGESLLSVLKLADRYPEHSFGKSGSRWPLMIKQLIAERDSQPENFDKQLKEKLGWYVNGQTDVLKRWIENADSTALKEFMDAVSQVN